MVSAQAQHELKNGDAEVELTVPLSQPRPVLIIVMVRPRPLGRDRAMVLMLEDRALLPGECETSYLDHHCRSCEPGESHVRHALLSHDASSIQPYIRRVSSPRPPSLYCCHHQRREIPTTLNLVLARSRMVSLVATRLVPLLLLSDSDCSSTLPPSTQLNIVPDILPPCVPADTL